jgi:hypothetical protein
MAHYWGGAPRIFEASRGGATQSLLPTSERSTARTVKIVVGTVRRSRARTMAALGAKTGEPEEHQGCTRAAANQHQRCAVEPVVVVVDAWPDRVPRDMDPREVVLVFEPEGPDTFHDGGIAGTVRELIGEALWTRVQRIDEAMLKFSDDRAASQQAKGNEYRLGILGALSHQRQDLVRILEIAERSVNLQRGCACDQRIELASNNWRAMRFRDKHKNADEDNAPRSAQGLGKLAHGRIHQHSGATE